MGLGSPLPDLGPAPYPPDVRSWGCPLAPYLAFPVMRYPWWKELEPAYLQCGRCRRRLCRRTRCLLLLPLPQHSGSRAWCQGERGARYSPPPTSSPQGTGGCPHPLEDARLTGSHHWECIAAGGLGHSR